MDTILAMLLPSYLLHLPVYLTLLIGGIVSVIFWRRNPKVSLLTIIAVAGFLITSILSVYTSVSLPLMMHERGETVTRIGLTLGSINLAINFLEAVFWVLLLVAVFGWRGKQKDA